MRQRRGAMAYAARGGVLAVIICGVGLLAPASEAFYAGPFSSCEQSTSPTNKHCYAIADWYMRDGYSSGVNGATLQLVDEESSVPGWKSGDFATNEMWTAFHDIPNSWVESGEVTGVYSGSATKPIAFYAFQNQVSSSFRFFAAPANVPAGSYFWVENLYVGNGIWDSYIEGAGPFQMVVNLPGGADRPQDGLEMTASNISNWGVSREPVWEAPSGHWQYGWYDPYSTASRGAYGWQNFGNWAGNNTAPTCAMPTGTPGAVEWTSWPYPNPNQTSCFTGDNNNFGDIVTKGGVSLSSAAESESSATLQVPVPPAEPPATPLGQQPAVAASDWPTPPVQSGSALSLDQLKSRVLAIASLQGDAEPSDIQAVSTNRGDALQATNDGAALPNTSGSQVWAGPLKTWYGQQAYVVTAHGHFTGDVPTPAGSTGPTGTVLTLVLDAHSGAVSMLGIDKTGPSTSLGNLGAVKGL
jgi:hypothetical protein